MNDNIKISLDGNGDMRLGVPITKVDKENRLVSGFATLNNVDRHGDIVDASASAKAFERFRGNIREMHQPLAVGKMVAFETKGWKDKDTDKTYEGVHVTAYVSKGAESTWQKVLDGTLSGFSIGAKVLEQDTEKGDDGEDHRVIKDYELFELSLVDSPANQFANVMSITKTDDGMTLGGLITIDEEKHCNLMVGCNVRWKDDRGVAYGTIESIHTDGEVPNVGREVVGSEESPAYRLRIANVLEDGTWEMTNMYSAAIQAELVQLEKPAMLTVDFDEMDDEKNSDPQVGDETLEKSHSDNVFSELLQKLSEISNKIGGATMNEENTDTTEVVETEEVVEKAADVSEVEDTNEAEVTMTTEEIIDAAVLKVLERLSESAPEADEAEVAEQEDAVAKAVDPLKSTLDELTEMVKSVSESLDAASARIENLENSTAGRKSGDLEGDKVEKSNFWGSNFTNDYNVEGL